MSKQITKKQKLSQHLSTRYRFVILNDENLKEVGSYRLNLLNVYVVLSTLFIVFSLIALAIVMYTPVKYLVPNYGELKANKEFVSLLKKTDAIEKELYEVTAYIEGNKDRLYGNITKSKPMEGAYSPNQIDVSDIHDHDHSHGHHHREEVYSDYLVLRAPVTGIVSSEFKLDDHIGIDILAAKDATVVAVADGYVISSEYNFDTGNTIAIQHGNNMISFYKHNNKLLKKVGQYVSGGEPIAIMGNTGELSSGPHLHFELWIDGMSVDPRDYIKF